MSEINFTKRKEKCENCTKQVCFCFCMREACEIHGFYLFFYPLHSATRKTVMMVLAHLKRKMSVDR